MSTQMKFCPSCGGKLPEPAPKFCPNCGAPLQANGVPANSVPAPAYFPTTGTQNSAPAIMSFGEAIGRFWLNYFNFSGRASRAEYWWSVLFVALLSLIPITILATFIPMMAVTCRRFRDARAKIGYGLWITLNIFLGISYFITLCFTHISHGYYFTIDYYYSDGQVVSFWIIGILAVLLQIYHFVICCWTSGLKRGDSVPRMIKIPEADFSIGKYPVTRQEYFDVTENDPARFRSSPDLPVENVSWNDAVKFCVKLTERERQMGRLPSGYVYTLPTSEEWEYACRAGTTTKFYSGDTESDLAKVAWYSENSGKKTHPVGQKEPNAWGFYDMHGNVGEWCVDTVNSKFIYRGGSWCSSARNCESSRVYNSGNSNYCDNTFGFRIALVPAQ